MAGLAIKAVQAGVEFGVKVVPGSSRDRIAGLLGDVLKVAVSAPPEKGKANDAVVAILAKTLGVPRKSVSIVAGHTQPRKTVHVDSITSDALAQKLGIAPA